MVWEDGGSNPASYPIVSRGLRPCVSAHTKLFRGHQMKTLKFFSFAVSVVLLFGHPAHGQFKRPVSPTPEQSVSPRIKLTIMNRPADKGGCGMLTFSPDGSQLFFGAQVIGSIPSRPVPPQEPSGGTGSTTSAAVTSTTKEVDDGVLIGKAEIRPRERIATRDPVVLGGSLGSLNGQQQRMTSAVAVYSVHDGTLVRTFQPMQTKRPNRREICDSGLLSHDGKLLACFSKVDVFLTMYESNSGRVLFQVPRTQLMFKGGWGPWSAFTQDSSALMTVRKGQLFMYSATSGELLDQEYLRNRDGISKYSGSLHTARTAKRFFYGTSVWNSETAELLAPSVDPRDSGAQSVNAVSSDGTVQLVAHTAYVFAVESGQQHMLLNGRQLCDSGVLVEPWVNAVALTDDGQTYAAAYGKKIFLGSTDASTGLGVPQHTIEGHLQSVDRMSFSRDGALLASTSLDGSTRIWDVTDLTRLSKVAPKKNESQPIPRSQWHAWGPEQAIGPPDSNTKGSSRNAWSPSTSHNAADWLLLEFENSVSPTGVVVHEVSIPGGIRQIDLIDDEAQEYTVWTNDVLPPRDNVQERTNTLRVPVNLAQKQKCRFVRLDMHPGWNEIDAVGIEASNGDTHWAVRAEASSAYQRNEIHESLRARYPTIAALEFNQGDRVQVLSRNRWQNATVLKVGGPSRWTIRYDGSSARYDETVDKSRIRHPEGKSQDRQE